MKRLLTWMLIGAALAGCGKAAPPVTSTAPTPTVSAPAAATPAPQNSTPVAAPAEQAPVAEAAPAAAVSEFGSDVESLEQKPLALRVTETKPQPASQFKEGVHYLRIVPTQPTQTADAEVEVAEAFWYGCSHCYDLDPYLESWRKQGKPAYVNLVRVPVIWDDRTRMHARLFYTAELLNKLDELHAAIFREINVNNMPLDTAESVEAFFISHGVDKNAFDKAFSSFAVEASLKRAATFNRRFAIESVPTVIVNGKYLTDVSKAGNQQALLSLINELASREHGT